MKKFITLAWGDLQNTTRDSFLIMMYCIPILLAVVFRFGLPPVAKMVSPWVDLTEHYRFIMSFLAFITPGFVGMIMGFILLDERDEDILSYIAVTPLSRSGYLIYRIISPMLISFVISYLILFIAHLSPVPMVRLIPVLFMTSMEAPMLSLFLAAFANNKVEGLAVYKLTSLIYLAPAVGYFIKSGWAYLAGILPPFWITKAYLACYEPYAHYWVFIGIGILVHAAFIALMLRRFNRRVT